MGECLKHIFVIDDDEINNLLCKKIIGLSEIAEIASFSTNVEEGIGKLRNFIRNNNAINVPELIFLDINMPVEDGFDFLDKYMEQGFYEKLPDTKIIMLTTSLYEKDQEKAFSYPCVVDYIPKPLTTDLLKDTVIKHFMVDNQASV